MKAIIYILINFMVLHLVNTSPDGIRKRAHILPPKSVNNTDTQPSEQVQTVNRTLSEKSCPSHLVPHNVSDGIVCCVPYFNCGIDHGIKPCEKDGEDDLCVPCPPGWVQKNNVSSLNMEEAECYSSENTENCMIEDTKPSRKLPGLPSCYLMCECKNEDCYYGKDPCACSLTYSCRVNFTMNRETGVCEPCPWYAYKDYEGCGTCTIIPELWRVRDSHTLVTYKTEGKTTPGQEETTKAPDYTDGEQLDDVKKLDTSSTTTAPRTIVEVKGIGTTVAFVGVSVAVVLLVALVIVGFIYFRRRKHTGSSSQLIQNPGQTKQDAENIELQEIPDGFQTGGKWQKVNQATKFVTERHNTHDPYEEQGAVGGYDPESGDLKIPNDNYDDTKENGDHLHENMPLLLNRNYRHNVGDPDRQNISHSDLKTRDYMAPSPLPYDPADMQMNMKGGARPKTIQNKLARQSSDTKGESELTTKKRPFNDYVGYYKCNFHNCKISNSGPVLNSNGPVLVNQIREDVSLVTSDESSDFSTLPIEVQTVSGNNDRQVACREDRKYRSGSNFPPNICEEHATTSVNISDLEKIENNAKTHVVEHKTRNDNTDKLSSKTKEMDKVLEGVSREIEYGRDTRTEDFDLNDSLMINVSKDLKASIEELGLNKNIDLLNLENDNQVDLPDLETDKDIDLPNIEEDKQAGLYNLEKDKQVDLPNLEKYKPVDLSNLEKDNHDDAQHSEPGSGVPSPTSSGSDTDDSKPKRKIWGSSNNIGKPTARVEPIRQNSSPEHRQTEVLVENNHNHETSYRSYMSALTPDSYPLLHAQHTPSDVANIDDLESLYSSSIASYPMVHAEHLSADVANLSDLNTLDPLSVGVSEPTDTGLVRNELSERGWPEGCSRPDCCDSANEKQPMPDSENTYRKTVYEGHDDIARQSSEETFLKSKTVRESGSNFCDVIKNKVEKVEKDSETETLDEITEEKMKQSTSDINLEGDNEKQVKPNETAVRDSLQNMEDGPEAGNNCEGGNDCNSDGKVNVEKKTCEEETVTSSDDGQNTDPQILDQDASVEIDIDCLDWTEPVNIPHLTSELNVESNTGDKSAKATDLKNEDSEKKVS